MKKLVKVHMLPTKDGTIWVNKAGKLYSSKPTHFIEDWKSFNLYFTSNEYIMPEDWYINTSNKVDYLNRSGKTRFEGLYDNCRKVVATTDKALRGNLNYEEYYKLRKRRNKLRDDSKDWSYLEYNTALRQIKQWDIKLSLYEKGVKEIPQQFIEEYCKAGGIDEVYLDYLEHIHPDLGKVDETIKTDQNNCVIIHPIKPKLYTDDEVELLIRKYIKDNNQNMFTDDDEIWIKENLK